MFLLVAGLKFLFLSHYSAHIATLVVFAPRTQEEMTLLRKRRCENEGEFQCDTAQGYWVRAESPSPGVLPMCQEMSLLTPRSLKKMPQLRLLHAPNCKLPRLKVAREASRVTATCHCFVISET